MVCKLGDRGHMMHTYANKLEVVSQIRLKRYSSTHEFHITVSLSFKRKRGPWIQLLTDLVEMYQPQPCPAWVPNKSC